VRGIPGCVRQRSFAQLNASRVDTSLEQADASASGMAKLVRAPVSTASPLAGSGYGAGQPAVVIELAGLTVVLDAVDPLGPSSPLAIPVVPPLLLLAAP
jgi:hypothetical protein